LLKEAKQKKTRWAQGVAAARIVEEEERHGRLGVDDATLGVPGPGEARIPLRCEVRPELGIFAPVSVLWWLGSCATGCSSVILLQRWWWGWPTAAGRGAVRWLGGDHADCGVDCVAAND
jgi:hypothetical protein